jgi:CheY-like chemotaxis protein
MTRTTIELSLEPMGACKLLVVEDDADIRDVLTEELKYRGYAVDTAENGAEALRVLRKNGGPHDLVLVDLMMPVMDGWELLHEMRGDERLQSVPVIVTTGAADPGGLPADVKVFRKPYSVDALVSEIDQRSRRSG